MPNTEAGWVSEPSDYRVVEIYPDVCEPQIHYNAGNGKMLWFPLDRDGAWAEPDAFSTAEITVTSLMTRAEAERAVTCARRINGEVTIRPSQGGEGLMRDRQDALLRAARAQLCSGYPARKIASAYGMTLEALLAPAAPGNSGVSGVQENGPVHAACKNPGRRARRANPAPAAPAAPNSSKSQGEPDVG